MNTEAKSDYERWDARLELARSFYTGHETPEELDRLRIFAGTLSPLHRSGNSVWSRVWNWLFDTESVRGIPPIMPIVAFTVLGLWVTSVIVLAVSA